MVAGGGFELQSRIHSGQVIDSATREKGTIGINSDSFLHFSYTFSRQPRAALAFVFPTHETTLPHNRKCDALRSVGGYRFYRFSKLIHPPFGPDDTLHFNFISFTSVEIDNRELPRGDRCPPSTGEALGKATLRVRSAQDSPCVIGITDITLFDKRDYFSPTTIAAGVRPYCIH